MRKIIPPPNAVSAFTGSAAYVGNDDEALTKNLAENCDIEGIMRALDHNQMPNLILTGNEGETLMCSARSIMLTPSSKVFQFGPVMIFNLIVNITLDDAPNNESVAVGDSGWYLTATTSSNT